MFFVPEIFRHGQRRMTDSEAGARLFVHLPENQDCLVQDIDILDFPVQFLAFAAPFSDPAKYADPLVFARDIVDHFHNEDGFSYAGAAE